MYACCVSVLLGEHIIQMYHSNTISWLKGEFWRRGFGFINFTREEAEQPTRSGWFKIDTFSSV
jgi:hypothetical protein